MCCTSESNVDDDSDFPMEAQKVRDHIQQSGRFVRDDCEEKMQIRTPE